MTPDKSKAHKGLERLKQLLANDEGFLKTTVREALEDVLEAEMEELLGAGKSERTSDRAGYRWGYYTRRLITRIGKIELRVPQDRQVPHGSLRALLAQRKSAGERAGPDVGPSCGGRQGQKDYRGAVRPSIFGPCHFRHRREAR